MPMTRKIIEDAFPVLAGQRRSAQNVEQCRIFCGPHGCFKGFISRLHSTCPCPNGESAPAFYREAK